MEKETRISGELTDIIAVTPEGDIVELPKSIQLALKGTNISIELLLLQTSGLNKYTGSYTITIKEP